MNKINDGIMKLFSLIFILSFSMVCMAQKTFKSSVNITSEFYQGKRLIIMLGNPWLPAQHTDYKYQETQNKFGTPVKDILILKGSNTVGMILEYPHPFGVAFFDTATQSGSGSDVFFIGKDKIDVLIGDFSKGGGAVTGKMSPLNKEYSRLRKSYKQFIDSETGDIKNMIGKLDVLDKYITSHPSSYVAMWDLVMTYRPSIRQEDKLRILSALNKFSDKLKQTNTHISYVTLLEQDLLFKKGVVVPNILINEADSLLTIASKNKYILVDFWFSSCGPCVAQFPELVKTYDAYKAKGFEIVGISTDSDKNKWQEAIDRYQLSWIQQLDKYDSFSNQYFIRKFPTNFLIDANGKILAVDIKPTALAVFLYANLGL